MAEVFGTFAGALSVAALFNNCVDCFEYIQLGRHFALDFERCLLKLDIIKIRLGRWGQAVAINDNLCFATDSPDGVAARQVQAILEEIVLLFQTVQKSSKRYKIGAEQENLACLEDKDMPPVLRRLHSRLGAVARQRQKQTSLFKKAAWALYDAKNFDKLVKEITGLVESLEKLHPVETTRRRLAEMEIEVVDDEPSLLALQDVAAGTDSVLSEAVAQKIEGIAVRNYAKDIKNTESARVLVGNEWAESVLARCTTISERTENTADSVAAKGASRVQIGNRYGGRGFFDDQGVTEVKRDTKLS
ncbi:related to Heterokaryon incompatibility protein s [Phialocephala subalpina]|uniref:Related to Heterokaryon incompatibility protein s n=1 Tax=Phialocephala subalpina TaxID=576137 RepID=A0A1L7XNW0_9HELO|nr:related to Heterokaryon incompatibility protein s [Phialocephala subalpina]